MVSLVVGTNTYITLINANTYCSGAIHSAAWDAATDDAKSRALVTATRMFERQEWVGAPYADPQTLAWPRSGVTDKYGTALSASAVPADVISAQVELAMALLENLNVQTASSSSTPNKRVKAGSVEVEFFRTPKNQATQYPKIVNDLVLPFLSSSASVGGSEANGTDNESSFDCDDEYTLNTGF